MPRPIPHQQGRINLRDLKLQIAKQLGPHRTQIYFSSLTRLLAQKLSKTEFNKFCILVLGRENIPLHNKLIRSILKNAYEGKTPPPGENIIALTQTGAFTKQSLHGNDPSSRLQTASPASLNQCNGNILPPSPLKTRIQKSPLGLNGKVDAPAQQSCVPPDKIAIKENGALGPCDLKRPRQHYQSGLAEKPPKVPCKGNSLHHNHESLYKKVLVESVKAIDMEEKEQLKESDDLDSTRSHLQAPLGVSFRPHSVGGRRRSSLSASSSACVSSSNYDSRELLHTEDLRKLMEKAAKAQGIEVTLDCANLLNNALDAYLKRLLKSTVEVARVSSLQEPTTIPICEQPATERTTFNGIWAGNHTPAQHSVESLNVNNGHRNQYMISSQDFRVAMELNPQQLGGDWPSILEKICIRSYEE